ncbi:MAG: phage holin family protein [Paludibacter sp.]|nr:phage holin family protein [Paludibacter sp.]
MKNYLLKFLAAYDYKSFEDFLLSLFPSYKYQLHGAVISLSVISGIINYLFGITPLLAVAMFIAIIIEILTGIRASKRQGKSFESFRFSRCIIKILIWLSILFIINAFKREFSASNYWIDIAAFSFFNFVYVASLTAFMVEYVTSILENVSVLKGKEKTALIEAIQGGWQNLLLHIKPKQ